MSESAHDDGPMSNDTQDAPSPDELEYGPSGYLPARASARARKIVLRAPLGLQWMIAAIVAGVVVVIAGVFFLNQSDDPPQAPYVETVAVADLGALTVLQDGVAAVSAAGPVRVYLTPDDAVLCEANGRIESDSGVWSASTGRGFGVDSLPRHPSQVHDGVLWVDFTRTVDGPAASSQTHTAQCPA